MDTLQYKANDIMFPFYFFAYKHGPVLTQDFRLLVGQNLVENVVVSLSPELEDHTRLFQQV